MSAGLFPRFRAITSFKHVMIAKELPPSFFFSIFLPSFLDAFSHLYKRVCPFVGPSVRPSVHPFVGLSVTHELKPCKITVFDQIYWQYERERILCRVSGLVHIKAVSFRFSVQVGW